eukprot:scaffold21801_cov72-Phaeocystis_antarctica.AAC.2
MPLWPADLSDHLLIYRYGDGGQNYKNIAVLLKSLPGMPFKEGTSSGCQRPARRGLGLASGSLWSVASLLV